MSLDLCILMNQFPFSICIVNFYCSFQFYCHLIRNWKWYPIPETTRKFSWIFIFIVIRSEECFFPVEEIFFLFSLVLKMCGKGNWRTDEKCLPKVTENLSHPSKKSSDYTTDRLGMKLAKTFFRNTKCLSPKNLSDLGHKILCWKKMKNAFGWFCERRMKVVLGKPIWKGKLVRFGTSKPITIESQPFPLMAFFFFVRLSPAKVHLLFSQSP